MAHTIEKVKEALNNYKAYFKFRKLDGEVRHALGTTNLNDVPVDKHPKGIKQGAKEVVTFFDLQKEEWRSFRKDSFIDLVYVFR